MTLENKIDVRNAILTLIFSKQAEGAKIIAWREIVQAVKEANIQVKNWLEVRNQLHSVFVWNGRLARTADLRVEEYAINF